jgi:hypothetical protein
MTNPDRHFLSHLPSGGITGNMSALAAISSVTTVETPTIPVKLMDVRIPDHLMSMFQLI